MIRLWDNAWSEFILFLDYDVEIRRVICSTNAIESLNARYLVTRSLAPTDTVRARWMMRWKPAPNAFAITFGDRFPAAETIDEHRRKHR